MATTSVFAAGPWAYNQIASNPSSNLYNFNNKQGIDTSGLSNGVDGLRFGYDSVGNLLDNQTGEYASKAAVDAASGSGGLAGMFKEGLGFLNDNSKAIDAIGGIGMGLVSAFNSLDQMKSRELNREAMKEQMERAREDWQATKDYRNSYTPASRRA